MKALSIRSDFAMLIATGYKTIEVRTWKTDYRGDILICANANKIKGAIPGHAICIAEITDCVIMRKKHCKAACMNPKEWWENAYFSWVLDNIRVIEPIPVKGKLSLWNFNEEEKIHILDAFESDERDQEIYDQYWKPLIV